MKDYDFSYELEFTRVYRNHEADHPAMREAACLRVMFPRLLKGFGPGDRFAGRIAYGHVGFSPEPGGLGYFCNSHGIKGLISGTRLDRTIADSLGEMLEYWSTRTTAYKVRKAYPPWIGKALWSDEWMQEPMVACALYRMGGTHLDYGKLVELGIPGLRACVNEGKAKAGDSGGDIRLFEGMNLALDILVDCCTHYRDLALVTAEGQESIDAGSARDLREMAAVLDSISHQAPSTLREAMQLTWLYSIISGSLNLGRLDVILGDLLAADLREGRLTREEAQALFNGLWSIIADRKTTWNGRVIIGGKGRRNEANADMAALMAMEASRVVIAIEPQLTLRTYTGMNPALLEKAYQVIGEGRTYPMLYNDDVNVDAVMKAFGVDGTVAEQYVPFGCGEYIIDHAGVGTPSGIMNLLKALEITLRNGRDGITGKLIGLETGDARGFTTFEELYTAYTRQVGYFMEALAAQEALEYRVCGEEAPFLHLSMLYDDCMERGEGIFSGGVRYLGGTMESYGNINTSDSLAAIKEAVYDKGLISMDDLLKALDADFEGYEGVRRILKGIPKYGNDHDCADTMAVRVHEHVCKTAGHQARKVGLSSYLVVIINNSANTSLGKLTAASADGRRKGEHMANANNPWGGNDKSGLTAMLNSLVKLRPDIHAGAVQNMKFSHELWNGKAESVRSLLRAYFDNGGSQAMISVLNRGDLERAMEEPEKYGHIMVRVGGFSARFVELDHAVQREILSRTHY